MKIKLFIVVNTDHFFLTHRLPIALSALKKNYEVIIIAKDTGYGEKIKSYGLKFINIPFERSVNNPFKDMHCIYQLYHLYQEYSPDIIHHVTIKVCLLGSISAKLAGIKNVINAISGFGYNFTNRRNGILQKITRRMIKFAFSSKNFQFILQNQDDIKLFSEFNMVPIENIHLIKGSGVDLRKFAYNKEENNGKVQIILHARMLYDKGVIEFINAAKIIKNKVKDKAEFLLIGKCDLQNPAGIPENKLISLMEEPYIRWVGYTENIIPFLNHAGIIVLPSYREGLPKSLIEGCAIGRPVITTDTEGCRECVIDAYNGYLVPVKNSVLLAEKIEYLINNPNLRHIMGKRSRTIALRNFRIESVIHKHLSIYELTLKNTQSINPLLKTSLNNI